MHSALDSHRSKSTTIRMAPMYRPRAAPVGSPGGETPPWPGRAQLPIPWRSKTAHSGVTMILERSQHGLVQVLTLNRPEAANSLNPELLAELGKALHEISTDDGTQVVILTGAGEKIFCAGMDLRAFSESKNEPAGAAAAGADKNDGEAAPAYDMKN